MNINDSDVMEFMAEQESQYLESASFFAEKLKERLRFGHKNYGDPLPWQKTHNLFRLRPARS